MEIDGGLDLKQVRTGLEAMPLRRATRYVMALQLAVERQHELESGDLDHLTPEQRQQVNGLLGELRVRVPGGGR